MKLRIVSAIFALFTLVVFPACDSFKGSEGPTGPPGASTVSIHGIVISDYAGGSSNKIEVSVFNCKLIPSVSVNGYDLWYDITSNTNKLPYFTFKKIIKTPFQAAQLNASFMTMDGKDGIASAQITLPGSFEITQYSPSERDKYDRITVPFSPNEVLGIAWSSSENVEVYIVDFVTYIHITTQNENINVFNRDNTVIADTLLVIRLSDLFPEFYFDKIEEAVFFSGYVRFTVHAISGPHNPGDFGNVTGDAEGMFYGMRSIPEITFSFTLPGASKQTTFLHEQDEIDHKKYMYEMINKWLKQSEISLVEFIEKGSAK